jgi:dihydroorotate dehydrogenase (NAD+) catalytic subunit
VRDAGASAVVLGNALPAAMPDGRPGGLSGPAVRPVALRVVREVVAALPDVPVVGCGGIATVADARSFLDAGAVAVQVGTALLHDPTSLGRVAAGLAHPPAPEQQGDA